MNFNFITKEAYTNGNDTALEKSKKDNNFKSDFWLTYLQAKDKGIKIKSGSRGTAINIPIFDKDDDEKKQPIYVKKAYLFNLDQTEPVKSDATEPTKIRDFSKAMNAFNKNKNNATATNDTSEVKVAPEQGARQPILLSSLKFELK